MSPLRTAAMNEAEPAAARRVDAPEPCDRAEAYTGAGDVLLRLQRTHGNRYVQRLLQPDAPVVQPKLRLGPVGDRYEREADRLAEEIGPDSDGERRRVSVRGASPAGSALDPAAERLLRDVPGQGRPLPADVRRRYEHSLGADLTGIRLHTDGRADELNLRFRSSAFTTGRDIFFRRGEYDPASDTGHELLAHELVHAVQQGEGGEASPLIQRMKRDKKGKPGPQEKKLKQEEVEEEEQDVALYDKALEESDGEWSEESDGEWSEESEEEPVTTGEIPVEYFDLDQMTDYLREKGLRRGDPKPISVGVVVWNINHLKADDQADDDEGATTADDMDLESKPPPSYDPVSITTVMEKLQQRLVMIDAKLEATADNVIEGLPKKTKSEAIRSARREVSQLKADIHEISRLQLGQVLTPGIEAMRARTEGHQAIGQRADQLQSVRALNRIWQRLTRLRTVLIGGNTKNTWKANARERLRGLLTDKSWRLINEATALLLKLLPVADLDTAISALKRETVVDLTTRTFLENKAVNLVLINEMNLGIGHLATAARKRKLGLSKGPVMLARGQRLEEGAESKAGITAGDDETYVGKQYEYYPAVHRAEGDQGLAPRGTFYVSTSGQFAVQGEEWNQAIPWNKGAATFRGIVVHRYAQGGQEFWAGVLHTTPAGKDLNRKKIWPQIRAPLTNLNQLARHFKIPLLIGGDFYIPPEGIVNAPLPEQKGEVEDLALLRHVKASNVARSVFLSAATQGPAAVQALIKTVEAMSAKNKTRIPKPLKIPAAPTLIRPGYWQLGHMTADDLELYWRHYRIAVYKLAKTRTGHLGLTAVKDSLAPKEKLGPLWSKTLGGGTLTQLDILRNYRRPDGDDTAEDPEPRFTMERALDQLGYRIVAAGSPTNPKESGRGENKVQLADMFIVNEYWKTARSGIVAPGTGQLKPMDDPGLGATRTYWKISDHSPVVVLLSTDEYAPEPFAAFDLKPVAQEEAVEANRRVWEGFKKRLATMKTTGLGDINLQALSGNKGQAKAEEARAKLAGLAEPETVDEVIDGILKLLEPLPTGPTKVVEEVRERARKLAQDIRFANPGKITPEIEGVLKQLAEWSPFYPVDFSDKSLTDDLAGTEIPAGGSSSVGEKVPPGSEPPGGKTSQTEPPGGGIPGGNVGGVQPDWPTGQIEHGLETCYLAALIHVFASHQDFTSLLSAEQNPITDQHKASIQKSMGELVALLRDPTATIKRGIVEKFVRDLDDMGNILSRGSLSAINPSKAKHLKKKAASQAQQALADKTAFGFQQDAAEILAQLLELLKPPKERWVITMSILADPGADVGTRRLEKHLTIPLSLGTGAYRVGTISEALSRFTDIETLETGQQKQLLFARLPQVLTLVLKRFKNVGGTTSKIAWKVRPDDPLVIPDECLSGQLTGTNPTYRLVHVVHHAGQSPHSGHYTSLGKLTGTEQWYQHDDMNPPRRRLVGGPGAPPPQLDDGYIYVYVRQ